jgi:hypothetical protein
MPVAETRTRIDRDVSRVSPGSGRCASSAAASRAATDQHCRASPIVRCPLPPIRKGRSASLLFFFIPRPPAAGEEGGSVKSLAQAAAGRTPSGHFALVASSRRKASSGTGQAAQASHAPTRLPPSHVVTRLARFAVR